MCQNRAPNRGIKGHAFNHLRNGRLIIFKQWPPINQVQYNAPAKASRYKAIASKKANFQYSLITLLITRLINNAFVYL